MKNQTGRHWVFLRGLVREQRHWHDFPQTFQKHFPDDTVEMLDLPGAGVFHKHPSPTNLTDYVEFLRAHSTSLKSGQKISLLAVSLGAMVAYLWAKLHPTEVKDLVLMNTSSGCLSPFYRRLNWFSYKDFIAALAEKDLEKRERKILDLTVNLRTDKKLLAQDSAKYAQEFPISHTNFLRQMFAASRFKLLPGTLQVNALLLNSLGDRLVHPECSAALAQRLNVPIKTHVSAGHDLGIDDPDWTCDVIREFLARNS